MTSDKRIGILIARMTSSRLPGKSLRQIAGRPLVAYVLERLQAVSGLDEIWLATTAEEADAPLAAWGKAQGLHVLTYPGKTDDVVGRITAVLDQAQPESFIFALGDSPFVDTALMQRFIDALTEHSDWGLVGVDGSLGPSIHHGIGCYRAEAWRRIDAASQTPMHREHLASVLREQPDLVTTGLILDSPDYHNKPYRLTVDTKVDVQLMETLIEALQQPGKVIPFAEVVAYLDAHPDVAQINTHVRQRTVEESSLKVLMAVQAGGAFGRGHLSRCQTLAQTLEEYFSASNVFWMDTPDPALRQDLSQQGYAVINADWSLSETLRQGHYHRLVLDFQTSISQSLIRELRRIQTDLAIVSLDNASLGCDEVDAVVLPNAHGVANPDWSPALKCYSGAEYTVLGQHIKHRERVEDGTPFKRPFLLITMGGTDPGLMSEKILKALEGLEECHIDLVVPPHYPNPEHLEQIATHLPSTVTLYWRTNNLKALMQHATLAIAAFGITAYELAYMGVPTLLVAHHPAQVPEIERFTQYDAAINLGLGDTLDGPALYQQVLDILNDSAKRTQMNQAALSLLDDQGAFRVAQVIVETVHRPVVTAIGEHTA